MADPLPGKRFERALQSMRDIQNPLERLSAARRARVACEALESEAVAAARSAGATWKDIGAVYGLSKQGAQQRFRQQQGAGGRPAD